MKRNFYGITFLIVLLSPSITKAQQEIGHFAPGVLAIRDLAMPDSGFYGVLYNYWYTTDRVNDPNGDEMNSVTIKPGPGPGSVLDLNVNVDAYAIAPTLIWVSPFKVLGAKYGAYVSLSFSNTSVGASLATASGSGRSAKESQFGLADLYVQPLWLGWGKEHWDFALGYGFYAPTGKYETETITLPVAGSFTTEAADNIGLGFWTHQIQAAAIWYPWADRRMGIVTGWTYELHGEKKDFDLKPGQNLLFSWGISQYLPLKEDQSILLEIGPAGYDSWQVTNDSGADAMNPPAKDGVHAIGGQIGITHVPWNTAINFHYFYEFAAKDRFQGESIGLNLAVKF